MEQARVNEITKIITDRLDKANQFIEETRKGQRQIAKSMTESEIPGFENKPMKFGQFVEKEYVVMMTDIRKSTEIINSENGTVRMFKIFYAYSAVIANIVDKNEGTSTEFLGDGVLNLFEINDDRSEALRQAMRSSREILYAILNIMNPILLKNELPIINLGIGIDYGNTIVTRFGYKNDNDLKAFGKCVYSVSKLSKGHNEIIISEDAQNEWPTAVNGTLSFNFINLDGIKGYKTSSII